MPQPSEETRTIMYKWTPTKGKEEEKTVSSEQGQKTFSGPGILRWGEGSYENTVEVRTSASLGYSKIGARVMPGCSNT